MAGSHDDGARGWLWWRPGDLVGRGLVVSSMALPSLDGIVRQCHPAAACAHRCLRGLLLRFAPALARGVTLRAPVQTRLSLDLVSGSFALAATTHGRGRVRGWRLPRAWWSYRAWACSWLMHSASAQPMLWACGFSASATRRPYGLRRTSGACANCCVRRLGFGAARRLSPPSFGHMTKRRRNASHAGTHRKSTAHGCCHVPPHIRVSPPLHRIPSRTHSVGLPT